MGEHLVPRLAGHPAPVAWARSPSTVIDARRAAPGQRPQLHGRQVLGLVDDDVPVAAGRSGDGRLGLVEQRQVGDRPRLVVDPAGRPAAHRRLLVRRRGARRPPRPAQRRLVSSRRTTAGARERRPHPVERRLAGRGCPAGRRRGSAGPLVAAAPHERGAHEPLPTGGGTGVAAPDVRRGTAPAAERPRRARRARRRRRPDRAPGRGRPRGRRSAGGTWPRTARRDDLGHAGVALDRRAAVAVGRRWPRYAVPASSRSSVVWRTAVSPSDGRTWAM